MKKSYQSFVIFCALLVVLNPSRPAFAQNDLSEESEVEAEIESSEDSAEASSEDSFDEDESFGEESTAESEPAADEDLQAEGEEEFDENFDEEETKQAEGEDLEPIDDPNIEKEPVETAETPQDEPVETPAAPLELQAQTPVAPDEPDLGYESKLHDIFVNFYNAKTPQAEWEALVGSRNAERYRIQHGDNLWNVSQTIFGDGRYWPKVWSLNAGIKNPHLISPNNSIRFLLGDESEPPAFTVTENATEDSVTIKQKTTTTVEGEPAAGPVAEALDEAEPEIPAPLKVSRPVVKKLPPSLPVWQDVASRGNYDELGIDYARRRILDVEDAIPLTSYVSEESPAEFGRVSEIEVGHSIASAYQYIYVSMQPGQGQVGETYLVVANRGEVQSVHPTITGFLGFSVDVQGEVQLVERVTGSNELEKGEMYRALVLRIINPVGVGSILTTGKLERVRVTEEGPRSQVVAQIVGGSFFNRRQVYGNESITYLNRGTEDGLAEGQVLPIRANRRVRNINTEVESNIRPIGWLRIVKTTPHFSTAVIVRAWSDVLSGDLTGSGEMLPSIGMSGPGFDSDGPSAANLNDEFDSDEGDFEDGEDGAAPSGEKLEESEIESGSTSSENSGEDESAEPTFDEEDSSFE